MKNKFILTCLAIFSIALSSFANFYPVGIAVHPTENILVVAHESGNIIIIEKTSFKYLKTIKVLSEIESISFSKDGGHLWIFGENQEENTCVLALDSKTWTKQHEIECFMAKFSPVSNKLCYTLGYTSKEVKIVDMSSAESVGALKTTFTRDDASVDFFEFSTDGSQIILAERAYRDETCEILIFPSEGFVAQPLRSVISTSKISTGFGTGLGSLNNEYVLIGWSETIKVGANQAEVINRGYDFCYSFCSSPDGKYFFIGSVSGRASRYDFTTMKKTELTVEEINGATGDIAGICTTDGKLYYFITDEYIVGTINPEGFVLKQNFISMNVNVILDEYETKEIETIRAACAANGYTVEIPDEYDEENPVIIATNISLSDAYTLIEKMDDADIYCLVSIIE